MNQQYIYPQNLKASAKLWLWSLRDVAILGVALILSILALSQMQFFLPLAVTLVFAFLTIRLDDQTVLDFIGRGFRYFVSAQQEYRWQESSVGKRIWAEKDGEKA